MRVLLVPGLGRSPLSLAILARRLSGGEPNDGIVSVSETVVTDGAAPVVLPVVHTLMMNDKAVYQLITDRLQGSSR